MTASTEKKKMNGTLQRTIFAFVVLAIVVPPFFLVYYAGMAGRIIGMVVFMAVGILGLFEIFTAAKFNKYLAMFVAFSTVVCSYLFDYKYFEMLVNGSTRGDLKDSINVGLVQSWQVWIIPFAGVLILFIPYVSSGDYTDARRNMTIAFVSLMVVIPFGKSFWVFNVANIKYIFYIVPIAIIGDTFAYFGGMFFGKKWFKGAKLAPVISPKKTWAGFVIGCTATLAYAIGAGYGLGMFEMYGNLEWMMIVVVGLIVTIASPMGDLLFSWFKRLLEIKDYSNLIPGHGGVFDRIDSLSVVTTIVSLIMTIYVAVS